MQGAHVQPGQFQEILMHQNKILASVIVVAIIGGESVLAADVNPPFVMTRNGIFTDTKGMTLYIADNDRRANVSSCYDNCVHNWPAFGAPDDARDIGEWKVIIRDDGTKQWAYKGKPLYYFILDAAAGDKKGDSIGNIWHIAKP
jgi:predicted lipoprotein with Yx(FWY)xxD motif